MMAKYIILLRLKTTPDGYPAALLAVAQLHGAGQSPAKYVTDGDGRRRYQSGW